jgi:uncharacterized membrane protein
LDWLGLGHFWTALLAIVAGAVVVFKRKGTRFHRWAGRVYLAAMLALNASALAIYDLYGYFGPFHVAALLSLVSVLMGVRSAWTRKPAQGWRIAHAYWMCWSYVGLLAAAVSETATRYLDFHFGWTVAAATGMVILAGALVINRRLPPLLGLR